MFIKSIGKVSLPPPPPCVYVCVSEILFQEDK